MSDDINIIKKIRMADNGGNSYTEANIGTEADYVDYDNYDNSNVREALDKLNQKALQLQNIVENNSQTIREMNETFDTARKIINKINNLKTQVEGIPTQVELQVQKEIDEKVFYTKDIHWQPGIQRSLRSVLGNLVNLPLNATDLRDWMEKMRLGSANYNNLAFVPLSTFGRIEEKGNVTTVFQTAIASGKNIFLDICDMVLDPKTYVLFQSQMILGKQTIIHPAANFETENDFIYNFTVYDSNYNDQGTIETYPGIDPIQREMNDKNIIPASIQNVVFITHQIQNGQIFSEKISRPQFSLFESTEAIGQRDEVTYTSEEITTYTYAEGSSDPIPQTETIYHSNHEYNFTQTILNLIGRENLEKGLFYLEDQQEFETIVPKNLLQRFKRFIQEGEVEDGETNFSCLNVEPEDEIDELIQNTLEHYNLPSTAPQQFNWIEAFYNEKHLVNIKNINIRDTAFIGGMLYIQNSNQVIIQNCLFLDLYKTALTLFKSRDINIKNCRVSNCDRYAIAIKDSNNIIINNLFSRAQQFCSIISSKNINFENCEGIELLHNPIKITTHYSVEQQDFISTSDVIFKNCVIKINKKDAFGNYISMGGRLKPGTQQPVIYLGLIQGDTEKSYFQSAFSGSAPIWNYSIKNIFFENCNYDIFLNNTSTYQYCLIADYCSWIQFKNCSFKNISIIGVNTRNFLFQNNNILGRLFLYENNYNISVLENHFSNMTSYIDFFPDSEIFAAQGNFINIFGCNKMKIENNYFMEGDSYISSSIGDIREKYSLTINFFETEAFSAFFYTIPLWHNGHPFPSIDVNSQSTEPNYQPYRELKSGCITINEEFYKTRIGIWYSNNNVVYEQDNNENGNYAIQPFTSLIRSDKIFNITNIFFQGNNLFGFQAGDDSEFYRQNKLFSVNFLYRLLINLKAYLHFFVNNQIIRIIPQERIYFGNGAFQSEAISYDFKIKKGTLGTGVTIVPVTPVWLSMDSDAEYSDFYFKDNAQSETETSQPFPENPNPGGIIDI